MPWFLLIDESGHDHGAWPCEIPAEVQITRTTDQIPRGVLPALVIPFHRNIKEPDWRPMASETTNPPP